MQKISKNQQTTIFVAISLLLLCCILLIIQPLRQQVKVLIETGLARAYDNPTEPFPSIDTQNLNPYQQKIVSLARSEYEKKPVSFDATVLNYTQGIQEPWCADFASWIMQEAGQPLTNPNSGSWRIPGVYTLHEFYVQNNRYQHAGEL